MKSFPVANPGLKLNAEQVREPKMAALCPCVSAWIVSGMVSLLRIASYGASCGRATRAVLCWENAMSWKYSLSTGDLVNPACSRVGIGYSGRGIGLNNPVDQEVSTIGNFFDDPGGKGPLVAHLSPAADTETFGLHDPWGQRSRQLHGKRRLHYPAACTPRDGDVEQRSRIARDGIG
jgi:hypothetical protein